MKTKYWIVLWCFLIAICIGVGIYTKSSISDLSSNENSVLNMQYDYQSAEDAENINTADGSPSLNINTQTMIDHTPLIAKVHFSGKRQYQNRCFLSSVQILQVLKGDKNLENRDISVYEPASIVKASAANWEGTKVDPEWVKKFNLQGKSQYCYLVPGAGMGMSSNNTLMNQGQDYILFLSPKVYPMEKDITHLTPEFILADSPYAKISVDQTVNANNYKIPPKYITLEESLQFQILLKSKINIRTYFSKKAELIKKLGA